MTKEVDQTNENVKEILKCYFHDYIHGEVLNNRSDYINNHLELKKQREQNPEMELSDEFLLDLFITGRKAAGAGQGFSNFSKKTCEDVINVKDPKVNVRKLLIDFVRLRSRLWNNIHVCKT
jgi:hypothetical protein